MRGSSLPIYGVILLVLIFGALLGSLSYSDRISNSLATLESRSTTTISVNEPTTVEIPPEVYWALDDLFTELESTQQIIHENRYQIDTYYYQIDDLYSRLQAVEEELSSLLSDQRWN